MGEARYYKSSAKCMEKIKHAFPFLLAMAGIIFTRPFFDVVHFGYYLNLLEPIYLYSIAALPVTLVLLFVKGNEFKIWLRFAVPWLIFSVLVIVVMPQYSSLFQPSKEDAARWMGSLFSIISVAILAVLFLRAKWKGGQ